MRKPVQLATAIILGAAALVAGAASASATTPPLTIAGPRLITYGATPVVSTKLTIGGAPVSGATVTLYVRSVGSTTERVAGSAVTNSSGAASVTVNPHVNVIYHWVYVVSTEPAVADSSADLTMSVAQRVIVATSTTGGRANQPITLYGTVDPTHAGQFVQLEYRKGTSTSWLLSSVKAELKSQRLPNGQTKIGYVMTFTLPYTQYRVYKSATSTNVAGASPRVLVVISG